MIHGLHEAFLLGGFTVLSAVIFTKLTGEMEKVRPSKKPSPRVMIGSESGGCRDQPIGRSADGVQKAPWHEFAIDSAPSVWRHFMDFGQEKRPKLAALHHTELSQQIDERV